MGVGKGVCPEERDPLCHPISKVQLNCRDWVVLGERSLVLACPYLTV